MDPSSACTTLLLLLCIKQAKEARFLSSAEIAKKDTTDVYTRTPMLNYAKKKVFCMSKQNKLMEKETKRVKSLANTKYKKWLVYECQERCVYSNNSVTMFSSAGPDAPYYLPKSGIYNNSNLLANLSN